MSRHPVVSLGKGGFFMSSTNRILTYSQVMARTGQSRTGLWRLVKAGRFPQPVDLGTPRRVGFYEHEVQDWIDARPRVTYGGKAAA